MNVKVLQLSLTGVIAVAASSLGGAAFAQVGVCKDPWINSSVREIVGRAPNGSGVTGECAPTFFSTNGQWTNLRDLQNKVTARLTSKGVAYAFSAPTMAGHQGHIGWAYILANGDYAYGATDAPTVVMKLIDPRQWDGKDNTFGIIHQGPDTNSPWRGYAHTEQELYDAFRGHYGGPDKYTEVKQTFVSNKNPGRAEGETIRLRGVGYGLVGNNCMDHVYSVLAAYGVPEGQVMQWKQTHPAPNSWFRAFGRQDMAGRITKVDNQPGDRI